MRRSPDSALALYAVAVLTPLILFSQTMVATAASDVWDGNGASPPNGIWGTDVDWVDNTTPGNGDTATFNVASTYNVSFDASPAAIQALTVSAGNVTFASSGGAQTLSVNSGGGQDVTVNGGATLSLGTSGNPLHLTVGDDLIVNVNSTLNVNFGSQVNTTDLIAQATSTNATIVVDGTGSALNRTGTGQRAFGNSNGTTSLTYRNNATGDLNDTLLVGNISDVTGTANLNVQSGADLTLDSLTVGFGAVAGPTATVTVNGSGSTITQSGASSLTVGRASGNTGILNINSSGVFTTGTGPIALNTTGRINLGGGTLNANGDLTMASGSILGIGGGTLNANADLTIGAGATFNFSSGVMAVGNGASVSTAADLTVGSFAGGTLTIENESTVDVGGNLAITSTSNVNLNGGQLSVDGIEAIGTNSGSTGYLNQSGGSNFVDDFVRIGDLNTGGTGNYSLTGGLLITPDVFLHRGQMTISGTGSALVNRIFVVADEAASVVNINGGRLDMTQYVSANNFDALNFNAGTVSLGGDHRTFSYTIVDQALDHLLPPSKDILQGRTLELRDTYIERNLEINGGTLSVENLAFNDPSTEEDPHTILEIYNGGTVDCWDAFIGRFDFTGMPSRDEVHVSGSGSVLRALSGVIVGNIWNYNGPQTDQNILTVEDQARVETYGLTVGSGGTFIIDGGTLKLNGLSDESEFNGNGTIIFRSGTIEYPEGKVIDGGDRAISTFFGTFPTITAGKGMGIDGVADFNSTVVLDGGTLTVGGLTDLQRLQLRRGTLNITDPGATIASGGNFAALDVNENMTVNTTFGLTNQGLVTGDGTIGGPFYNAAGGELRAQPGRSLALTGFGNTNNGQLRLFGGELDFTHDLTNNAGAFISGNGSLVTGGLINNGTMNFAGIANIVGDVTNSGTGKIISGGGGATIFYDHVTNNGEIRTSTNGFTVFFGSVSGGGAFTGTGTVNFEGGLSPGNSPAAVQFAGDVAFGPEATLQIELGGINSGTEHDKVSVTGDLAVDGTLEVSLIAGFTPSAGQSFNVLDWFGSVSGTFSTISLPTLAGLTWDTSLLYASGVLGVLSAALPGDHNGDGTVDVLDYVVWRMTETPPDGYTTWSANYGEPGRSGSVDSADTTVPEPATWVMLISAVAGWCSRKRRTK